MTDISAARELAFVLVFIAAAMTAWVVLLEFFLADLESEQ